MILCASKGIGQLLLALPPLEFELMWKVRMDKEHASAAGMEGKVFGAKSFVC